MTYRKSVEERDRETSSFYPQSKILPSKKNLKSGKPRSDFVTKVDLSTWLIYGFKEKKSRKCGASFGAGNAEPGCVSAELGVLCRWPVSESPGQLVERQSVGPPTESKSRGWSREFGGWTLWNSLLTSMSDNF